MANDGTAAGQDWQQANPQDTTAPQDWLKRLKEMEKQQPCPTCHTCPTCGRKTPGQFFPPYPGIPYYTEPYVTYNLCGGFGQHHDSAK